MKKKKYVQSKLLRQAVSQSSKIEGLSFAQAKKNTWVINKLKQYGRAFSVQHQ